MRTYDCKVRLGGSRDNEVRKTAITAAEIQVLRLFHGDDAVEDIKAVGTLKVPHGEVREHLFRTYVGGVEGENLGGHMNARAASLNSLFGPKHTPLPLELDEEVPEAAVPKRVAIPAKSGKAEDVAAAAAMA